MYEFILLGGTICDPRGRYRTDIAVLNGKIALLAEDLTQEPAHEKLDVSGTFILPGCIDSHTHLWEPGLMAKPDFEDGTLSAIAGGITTIIDHPLTIPEVLDVEGFDQKRELGERTSYTDFALHGGVGLDNQKDLPDLWQAGCTAFKIFMCESGSKVAGLADGELLAAFQQIGAFGGTVLLHAENEAMLHFNRKRLEKDGRTDYLSFVDWRPPEVEAEAIHRALYLLRGTGARGVFLHTTVPEGIEMIHAARKEGQDVWVETCPHNLYLTVDHLQKQGPWVTFSPPVRDAARVELLWEQLRTGMIQTVGSDHGPVDSQLKESGVSNIWESQPGVPGSETMVPLMLNAVSQGRITLECVTSILSEMPARLYGLYPQKGSIRIGSDADLTIVDMSQTYDLKADEMQSLCGWTPYEGWQVTGKVTHTIIRGKVVVRKGKILGQPGYGHFLDRKTVVESLH
jgi:allantoinase